MEVLVRPTSSDRRHLGHQLSARETPCAAPEAKTLKVVILDGCDSQGMREWTQWTLRYQKWRGGFPTNPVEAPKSDLKLRKFFLICALSLVFLKVVPFLTPGRESKVLKHLGTEMRQQADLR